jgi:tetratricopeptide (TPR) repeat protein
MNYQSLFSSLSLALLMQVSSSFLLSSCSVPSLLQQSSSNIPEQFKDQENLSGIAKTIRDKAEQFTVRIDYPNGNGSGVIVAKNGNTYYVLTAQHVVENVEGYEIVTPDDKKYKVDGSNITTKGSADLAVVQFQSDETYQVATLADYKTEFEEEMEKEMEKQQQKMEKQTEEMEKQTEELKELTAQIKSSGVNLGSMLQETTETASQVEDLIKKRLEERTGKSFEEIQDNLPQESTGQVEDLKKYSKETEAKSTSSGKITQTIEGMEEESQKYRKKLQEDTQKSRENLNKQLKKLQNPQYLPQWLFLLGWSRFNDSPSLSLSAGKDHTLRIPGMEEKDKVVFGSSAFDTLASNKGYELGYTNLSQGGMSGGAVLDTTGRVVGIHAAAEGERIGLGEIKLGNSFGVPIKAFLSVANQMGIKSEWLKVEKFRPQHITEADKQSIAKNLFELEPPGRNSTEIDWFNYGNDLTRIERYQEAIAAFDEAIKIKPDFYQAYYAKGQFAGAQDNKKISSKMLSGEDQGMKGFKEATVASFQSALKTLPYFQKAVEIKPDFYPAWKHIGLLYRTQMESEKMSQLGNKDSMMLYFASPPRLSPQATLAAEKALTAFNKATALNPSDTMLYESKGDVLQALSRHQEAIDAYSQGIKINPSLTLYSSRSKSYCAIGDKEKAEADMRKSGMNISTDTTEADVKMAEDFLGFNSDFTKALSSACLLEEPTQD